MTSSSAFDGPPGSVDVQLAPDHVLVRLAGEVDACLGPDLVRCVDEALAVRLPVVVEAARITFMDSTGLGFLARLASRSGERRITVTDPPEVVRHLVHRARLEQIIDFRPGVPRGPGA
ncbi:STAS domain-containing protein [Kineococcus sp. SYSU DK002]|uniref:STAS domain-containing protein n=1 Tax=Kineococcus sp. SYSU DK002 TaxID=3383123 RepID=UPI003D7D2BCB